MNSKQAKQINLPDLMLKLGYQPTSIQKGGYEYWYRSPFREEKEASFHASFINGKWIWKDFGDTGGTVIDFVIRYKGLSRVGEALAFLDSLYGKGLLSVDSFLTESNSSQTQNELFSFHQQGSAQRSKKIEEPTELQLIDVRPIERRSIMSYLTETRALTHEIVSRYLKEIHYRHIKSDKEYFAFGIANESGGYEIRAATNDYHFKSVLNGRDITCIRGSGKEPRALNIFEGMVDFLSLLVMMNTLQSKGDIIIMHSLSSFNRTCEVINRHSYPIINTFLDNDAAGDRCTELFITEYGELVKPQNAIYETHKDLNECLIKNFGSEICSLV